jgi:hypothetical protein
MVESTTGEAVKGEADGAVADLGPWVDEEEEEDDEEDRGVEDDEEEYEVPKPAAATRAASVASSAKTGMDGNGRSGSHAEPPSLICGPGRIP